MKKIMFSLAAATALGTFAAVESSNIVGYGQNSLREGYSLVTAQFVGIGGGVASLDSIKAAGTEASDNVTLSTVDEFGTAVDTYAWNDWLDESNPCWVDGSFEPVSGITVTPGMAFWTSGSEADQIVQTSGEVGTQDVVVNLREGYTLVGNPFPVDVSLQDIVAGGNEASDNVTLSTIDEFGTAIDTYAWNDWLDEDNPCWVDGSFEPVSGVTFAPGVGLWTSGSNDSQFVRFPAPEL